MGFLISMRNKFRTVHTHTHPHKHTYRINGPLVRVEAVNWWVISLLMEIIDNASSSWLLKMHRYTAAVARKIMNLNKFTLGNAHTRPTTIWFCVQYIPIIHSSKITQKENNNRILSKKWKLCVVIIVKKKMFYNLRILQ